VFGARFARFVPSMRFHPCEQIEGPRYGALSQADRDALTAAIADMIVWLERHEGKYTSASTADEYAWAHRAAIAARQMDSWLRQVPAAWTEGGAQVPAEEGSQFISAGTDIRDRAQVDNIEWILRREGVAGKLLVFASRYHLSAAPVKIGWSPDAHESVQEVAGTYLRRRLGEQLVTIGNLLGGGQIQRGNDRESLARPPAHSFEGLAREIGAPFFLLDVRCAPRDVAEWLSQEHQLAAGSHVLKLSVREAFDLLFYIDTVTPACENTALACEA
jgi:erythromycin esterase-like protein